MFGYVSIDKSKLNDNEVGLYQTFMCGLCLSTKKLYGNYARNFVNYDINFLNVLLHSFAQSEVEIFNAKCLSSPLKKRSLLRPNQLTDRLASANVALVYYNIYDDCVDGGGLKKKALLSTLKGAYAKAERNEAELCAQIKQLYEELRQTEKEKADNLDNVCHFFASLTQNVVRIISNSNDENLLALAYNLGKWIYLIDALDDYDKDMQRGNYNPLAAYFKQVASAKQLKEEKKEELNFIFYTTLNSIALNYNELNLTQYVCILNNVLYNQIRDKTKQLLGSKDDLQQSV